MANVLKILLPVLAGLYILSPYDLLPDFMPYLGRADDLFILIWLIYYLFKRDRLRFFGTKTSERNSRYSGTNRQERENAGAGTDSKPPPKRDPFQVLGVSPDSNPEEIKAAYRRESQRYHPDKVSHLGDELQELAKQKFIEIKEAYDELRARGGW